MTQKNEYSQAPAKGKGRGRTGKLWWGMAALAVLLIVGVACGGGGGGASPAPVAPTAASPTAPPPAAASPAPAGQRQPLLIPDIVDRLRPSVVQVQTERVSLDVSGQPISQLEGVGTGVIIDERGHIVTNDHVLRLRDGSLAQQVTVTLSDNRSLAARIVGSDPRTDLGVIKIDAQSLAPARLGNASELRLGDTVVAIGHALALEGGPTVSAGVVSAKDRVLQPNPGQDERVTLVGLIQTDVAINPGNSGGPLVNAFGEVVGINTAVIRGTGSVSVEGVSFSISIDNARPIVAELIDKGKVERGFLGISMVEVTPGLATANSLPVEKGVAITAVSANSPAARAGLQAGDVIVGVGGRAIRYSGDLVQALTEHKPGERVMVEFYRGSQRRSAEVTLGSPT